MTPIEFEDDVSGGSSIEIVTSEEIEDAIAHGGDLPDALPVLPLRDMVTYPGTLTPLAVGQERSIKLIDDVLSGDRGLVMVASKDPELDEPGPEDVERVGVAGVVARMLKVPDGTIRILVQGTKRVRLGRFVGTEPYLVATRRGAARRRRRGPRAAGADEERPAHLQRDHRGDPLPARRSCSSRSPTSRIPRRSPT